ncbi:MAG: preprotein translocase subunit SecA [Desulfobacteraceae bacterium]|nr:preprotein translocase subunit SecA [Desulfobacteraceae bacterium]
MPALAATNILTRIFGSKNERILKKLYPIVEEVNALEPKYSKMSDDELANQTPEFKRRHQAGESLDDLLPEAFAVVREASKRALGMRHFDVQILGGIVLHQGNIAEMKTGEGKTLVATLPIYLNALSGKGAHVVTVNDYLASRDAEWMGKIYRFLGMSVGTIVHGMDDAERKEAYACDIAYGTNNEFGFDYLRDNMKFDKESLVQRELNFAIVDEVDSILIDEARTPLIISGPAEKSTHLYYQVNSIVPNLKAEEDYIVDEKAKSVTLTEQGVAKAEKLLGVDNLYDHRNIELLHHVNQALKAHALFTRDVDYIVKEGKVIIVDEFTGRLMPGRRYSDGLHQALEAKESVKIENENQTLATITFQNFFRMYNKLSGMTGTADTEAAEFKKIYDLEVVIIPTNEPMIREDHPDMIYMTKKEKYDAAIEEIIELNKIGRPVLVGTVSIDVSEYLSSLLKKRGILHNVLNAKNHEAEAEIIANAGQKAAVTISTNMAGRGTDIVLGEGVAELGGLHILGTERHESRRIDNQLRGRAGRQGDPGSSRFYLSLEDDLLRIFGGERISGFMNKIGMGDGEPIEHKMISRAIENAQSKVEGHNFDIRKQLLDFDDVMNQQREVIYQQRQQALSDESLKPVITEMIREKAEEIAWEYADEKQPADQWDIKGLSEAVYSQFNLKPALDAKKLEGKKPEDVSDMLYDAAMDLYRQKEEMVAEEDFRHIERIIMLQTVDSLWKDHLLSMDHLKEGIGLRGYAQEDPLMVYKKEAFSMFQEMIEKIKEETLKILFRVQIEPSAGVDELARPREQEMTFSHGDGEAPARKPKKRTTEKIGRNAPCPCGSGKKYKKCCGAGK